MRLNGVVAAGSARCRMLVPVRQVARKNGGRRRVPGPHTAWQGNSFQPGRRETMTTAMDPTSGAERWEAEQDSTELFPKAGGLFDPSREYDACGVGFIADLKGAQVAPDRQGRALHSREPRASRCRRRRPDRRRRRRHPHPDPARRSWPRSAPSSTSSCRSPATMPSATSSCRRTSGCARTASACGRASSARRAWSSWAGARCRSTTPACPRWCKAVEPVHRQIFIGRPKAMKDQQEFERRLYLIRKIVSNAIYYAYKGRDIGHYTVSLSSRTLVYKGMFLSYQVARPTTRTCPTRGSSSAMALVHQRFSTNTFPSWKLAHPYRMVAHNGEINTLRGNVNWMAARQASVSSPLFGDDISKLWPISYEGQSDTACFDNALEFLVMGGYSLAHAAMMLIPEAWAGNPLMDGKRRAFYEYHACLMEPWDGPAAMAFTDGRQIGATLDRNGLRPARYLVTKDDRVIMSSEAGVLPVAEENIATQVAPAARQDAADRPGRGPHHLRRRPQGRSRLALPLRAVAEAHADPGRRPAAAQEDRRARRPTWRCSICSRRSATRRRA